MIEQEEGWLVALAGRAPRHIREIAPYQPGKPVSEVVREVGLEESQVVKLASNENPLGISEAARRAAAEALVQSPRYPDGNGFTLKAALSERLGVGSDCIVLGNGSNDVLELAARAFLTPGRSAVFSQHAFAVYPLVTKAIGAKGLDAPARYFAHDLEAMRAAIAQDTRIVFVANPNNPTGTFIDGERLEAFIKSVPEHVLVVVDEAYTEYLAEDQRYDSLPWLERYPNLLITRTFSKAYGLAGLRVGYGLGHPEVIDLMNRVRQPFNVNNVAQAAAVAALGDEDFIARSVAENRRGMVQLTNAFDEMKLEWLPSAGNFVAVCVGEHAAQINQGLLRRGVIVRPISGYGMPEWLRVSIGLAEENAQFIRALGEAMAEVGS